MKRKIQRLGMTEGNYAACAKGLKVQTRRRMNPQPGHLDHRVSLVDPDRGRPGVWRQWIDRRCDGKGEVEYDYNSPTWRPRYAVGDIAGLTLPHYRQATPVGGTVLRGTSACVWDEITRCHRTRSTKWPPADLNVTYRWRRMAARYMPVWACLHRVEIVGVRAEQLGEISAEDCMAEGITGTPDAVDPLDGGAAPYGAWYYPGDCVDYPDPLYAYAIEWIALHGAGSWDPETWVWVYDFKLRPKAKETDA